MGEWESGIYRERGIHIGKWESGIIIYICVTLRGWIKGTARALYSATYYRDS